MHIKHVNNRVLFSIQILVDQEGRIKIHLFTMNRLWVASRLLIFIFPRRNGASTLTHSFASQVFYSLVYWVSYFALLGIQIQLKTHSLFIDFFPQEQQILHFSFINHHKTEWEHYTTEFNKQFAPHPVIKKIHFFFCTRNEQHIPGLTSKSLVTLPLTRYPSLHV